MKLYDLEISDPLAQHKHFIARAEMRDFFAPDDREGFRDWISELVDRLDMNLLDGPHVVYVDRPGLRGWTGICIIETSHIAIHIWDEKDSILAQIDVYTCGDMDTTVILDILDQFYPNSIDFVVLDREFAIDEIESMRYVYTNNEEDDEPELFDDEDDN